MKEKTNKPGFFSAKYILLGLGCLAFVIAFLSGPRVMINTRLQPVILPEDIEQYVADSESGFDDIVPGAEKKIFWADKQHSRTPFAVIYLHGFSATRQETAPLSQKVAQRFGANLFCTRLTGHGRDGKAMLDGSVNAWLNDAAETLKIGQQIGEKIIIIGTSTGGTIASWLAAQPTARNIAAVILISPNFGPANGMSEILLWPWGGYLAELIIGKERGWEPKNPAHGKYWTNRYPTRALLPMMGMVKLTRSLDLSLIQTPVLVIYSPADQVVDAANIENTFKKFGSKRKQLIPYTGSQDPHQHVLAGDILSEDSTETLKTMIVDFILKKSPTKDSVKIKFNPD
ncbi:alpha/beta fold hydrolase [uncultured Desulfobacter sp.]|uniref:alpha/beta hydrolase n=1 Tax=uncultured Desulfobacter sp. TaxID=240139 RepID=UPI002AA896F6|nr:alpha/beta fold hydrolase [uncultured Desulfobacter sp.]